MPMYRAWHSTWRLGEDGPGKCSFLPMPRSSLVSCGQTPSTSASLEKEFTVVARSHSISESLTGHLLLFQLVFLYNKSLLLYTFNASLLSLRSFHSFFRE